MSTTTSTNPRLKRLSLLTTSPSQASSVNALQSLSPPKSPRRSALLSRQDVFNSQPMSVSPLEGASSVVKTIEPSKTDSLSSSVDENVLSPPHPRTRQQRPLSLLASSSYTYLSPSHRSSLSAAQQAPLPIHRHRGSTTPVGRGRERLISQNDDAQGDGNRKRELGPMSMARTDGERNEPTESSDHIPGGAIAQAGEAGLADAGGGGAVTLMDKYASLLTAIAQKESTVHETRQKLDREEEELTILKLQWKTTVTQSFLPPDAKPLSTPTTLHKQPPKPSFRSATHTSLNTQFEDMNGSNDGGIARTKAGVAVEEGKKLFGQFLDNLAGIQEGTTTRSSSYRNVEDSALNRKSNRVGNPTISLDSPISLGLQSTPPLTRAISERPIESLFSSLVPSPGTESSWAETAASWGDVVGLGSPRFQEGSKRATAFLSVNLSETLNALAKVLPTPNLATLTAPLPADGTKGQADIRPLSETEQRMERQPHKPELAVPSRPRSFLDEDLDETSPLPSLLTPLKADTRISSTSSTSRSSDESDEKDLAEWNW